MLGRPLRACVIAAFAAVAVSPAAEAAVVDLSPYVNTDIRTYTSGSDYPGGAITIGGVDFQLSPYGPDGVGIVQLAGGSSVSIPYDEAGVNTVYVIVNSAYGVYGFNTGNLTFFGANGDQVSFDLVEGLNIRDHYTSFNNFARQRFATATYPGGNRFDVYRYDISGLGGVLTSIGFSSTAGADRPNGEPFLAAVTTASEQGGGNGHGDIPEPAGWALMVTGFGLVGAGLRGRRAAIASI